MFKIAYHIVVNVLGQCNCSDICSEIVNVLLKRDKDCVMIDDNVNNALFYR